MADMRINRKTSGVGQGSGLADLHGTLDGGAFISDISQLRALNGNVFVANGGSASDPITFAGAFDADGPDLVMLREDLSPQRLDIDF